LRLPLEAALQTFVILAKRGAGKTYTAAVMAEKMLKAGLQVGPVRAKLSLGLEGRQEPPIHTEKFLVTRLLILLAKSNFSDLA
jgi:hypothetical protein